MNHLDCNRKELANNQPVYAMNQQQAAQLAYLNQQRIAVQYVPQACPPAPTPTPTPTAMLQQTPYGNVAVVVMPPPPHAHAPHAHAQAHAAQAQAHSALTPHHLQLAALLQLQGPSMMNPSGIGIGMGTNVSYQLAPALPHVQPTTACASIIQQPASFPTAPASAPTPGHHQLATYPSPPRSMIAPNLVMAAAPPVHSSHVQQLSAPLTTTISSLSSLNPQELRAKEDYNKPLAAQPSPEALLQYRDYAKDPEAKLPPSRRSKDFTFPVILYKILSEHSDCISWLPHGRAFKIHKPQEVEERVLPIHFPQIKFASFMRQVNGWGFRRLPTGPDRNAYYHEMFLRDFPYLCAKMKRPKHKLRFASAHPNFYDTNALAPIPQVVKDSSEPSLPPSAVTPNKQHVETGSGSESAGTSAVTTTTPIPNKQVVTASESSLPNSSIAVRNGSRSLPPRKRYVGLGGRLMLPKGTCGMVSESESSSGSEHSRCGSAHGSTPNTDDTLANGSSDTSRDGRSSESSSSPSSVSNVTTGDNRRSPMQILTETALRLSASQY